MENPINIDDLGVPLFSETSMYFLFLMEIFQPAMLVYHRNRDGFWVPHPEGGTATGQCHPFGSTQSGRRIGKHVTLDALGEIPGDIGRVYPRNLQRTDRSWTDPGKNLSI